MLAGFAGREMDRTGESGQNPATGGNTSMKRRDNQIENETIQSPGATRILLQVQ